VNPRATPSRATVHVNYALPRRGIPAAGSFRRWVEAALSGAGHGRAAELSIRIVDAEEGRTLNRTYRKRHDATNVLSFPAELPPGVDLPLLGDLVICAPVVAREASEQDKTTRDHYAHMTIHGVLHLLGHDHIEEAEAQRMEAMERRILAGLGIADPYR
jgi:probable rRNA maturation factor